MALALSNVVTVVAAWSWARTIGRLRLRAARLELARNRRMLRAGAELCRALATRYGVRGQSLPSDEVLLCASRDLRRASGAEDA